MSTDPKCTKEETRLETRWFKLRCDHLLSQQEGVHYEYFYVQKPAAVMIIPVEEDAQGCWTYFVEQYRHPVKRRVLQFPMGGVGSDGANPQAVAKQELLEETGLTFSHYDLLGEFLVDPGFSDQICHVFAAHGTCTRKDQQLEATESDLTFRRVRVESACELLQSGGAWDSWAMAGLFYLQAFLKEKSH